MGVLNKMTKNHNKSDTDLTPKQLRFCLEYMKDHNAKKAAVRAGYSEASAQVQGSRLLSHDKVKAFIARKVSAIAEKAGITADKVLQEMAAVGLVRLSDVIDWDASGNITMKPSVDLTPEQAAAICEVSQTEVVNTKTGDITTTTRLRMHPKVSALTKLAEWLGIGPDQLPPSVQVNIQAQDGSKVAVQINDVVKDYGEALDQALGIVKEIPPKKIGGSDNADGASGHDCIHSSA
jgi:phage terminase small subunit